ncbi:MAG: acyl-CoA/acyl-ACP dehydrogenase [Spirochaetes bacterium]|jgi:alkylation response protein AidB-like acyl-CoA dehydrogenase|nr:acyl-CoA/acyl-ACP dehydrogenase [Spirochaetota bacterium]
MNFDLTEEQKILRDSAKDFLTNECPKAKVREIEESDRGYSPELWKKMADLGWMGLLFPEDFGGSAGSFEDLAVLMGEMGYNICPGPYLQTVVLGGMSILSAGSKKQKEEFLPKIASGELIFTFAQTEDTACYHADGIAVKAKADKAGNYTLTGKKMFVPYANIADYIICVARTGKGKKSGDGITLLIVDKKSKGVKVNVLTTLGREKQCEVTFTNVAVPKNMVLGKPDKGWKIVKDVVEKATVALCAEMIGGARAVLDQTIKYSHERVQFDRPIGSFQAVQHHVANMWLDIKASRVLMEKAAWLISKGRPATKEIAMAKARTGESYRRITTLGHQVHGAISFTMENDMYLYHRRSVVGDLTFGNTEYQRQIVAREILG